MAVEYVWYSSTLRRVGFENSHFSIISIVITHRIAICKFWYYCYGHCLWSLLCGATATHTHTHIEFELKFWTRYHNIIDVCIFICYYMLFCSLSSSFEHKNGLLGRLSDEWEIKWEREREKWKIMGQNHNQPNENEL